MSPVATVASARMAVPVMAICVLLSLAVLSLLSVAVGANPAQVIYALVVGALGSQQALISTFRELAPIALCGLAFLVPFRAGFFNIGGQGQLELGALAAVAVVTVLSGSHVVVVPLALLAAIVAGAGAMLPAAILKVRRGASEITTTIMIYFAASQFVLAMVSGPMKDPSAFYSTTPVVPEAYRLPVFPVAAGIHVGVWLAIGVALIVAWMLGRTVIGFQATAIGGNRLAAAIAGISVDAVLVRTVLLSAGIAGLAGAVQALGVVFRVAEEWSKPWGFIGILAALLGRSPLGVLVASFALAMLETGGRYMQAMTGVPAALVYVLQGLPVILFLAFYASHRLRRLFDRSRGEAPLLPATPAIRSGEPGP